MGKRKIAKTFPILIQTFKTLKDLLTAQQNHIRTCFCCTFRLSVKALENFFRIDFQRVLFIKAEKNILTVVVFLSQKEKS